MTTPESPSDAEVEAAERALYEAAQGDIPRGCTAEVRAALVAAAAVRAEAKPTPLEALAAEIAEDPSTPFLSDEWRIAQTRTDYERLAAAGYDGIVAIETATLAALFAKLDETPEWEYAREYTEIDGTPYRSISSEADVREHRPDGHRADGSPYWNYIPVRRRKAGSWEPAS